MVNAPYLPHLPMVSMIITFAARRTKHILIQNEMG